MPPTLTFRRLKISCTSQATVFLGPSEQIRFHKQHVHSRQCRKILGVCLFVCLSVCLFVCLFVCFWRESPQWAMASSFTRFLNHNDAPQSVGMFCTSESVRRRDLYLTTHNTHNCQTSMSPVGFEPTTPTGERPQTYTLDRTATGTGKILGII